MLIYFLYIYTHKQTYSSIFFSFLLPDLSLFYRVWPLGNTIVPYWNPKFESLTGSSILLQYVMRWVLSWEQPKPMAGYMSKHTQALVYRFLGLKNGPHGIESTRWNRKVFWTCWGTDLWVSDSENYSLPPFKKDEVCIQSQLLLFLKNCHRSTSTLNSDQGPRPALTSHLHQLLRFLSSSISSFSSVLSKYFVLICWAELRRGLEIKRWKSLSSEAAGTFFEVQTGWRWSPPERTLTP